MYVWKTIEKNRCSTGKLMLSKREAQELLNRLQRNGRTRKHMSSLYNCPLCGMYHISSKEIYEEEDREQKPLIHGEKFRKLIDNNENE